MAKLVMAGLVPAIHVFLCCHAVKTWMAGTSPAMTENESYFLSRAHAGQEDVDLA
jgi:hypothetical protein